MKKYVTLFFAAVLFFSATGFVIIQEVEQQEDQKQEKPQKENKVKPLDVPDGSKADDLLKQLDDLKRDFAIEKRKDDSISNIRASNLKIAEKSLADLKKANAQYRKSMNRLIYILEKFDPDSVMKYYGEYQDSDSTKVFNSKKKISPSVILVSHKDGHLIRVKFLSAH